MARVDVTTQPITRAGVAPVLTAPTIDGDIVDVGLVALWVENAGVSPMTVTAQTPVTQDGLALADLTVTVPAGGMRLIGPLPARTFAQPTDAAVGTGRVLVDYSAVTDVTRAVITL